MNAVTNESNAMLSVNLAVITSPPATGDAPQQAGAQAAQRATGGQASQAPPGQAAQGPAGGKDVPLACPAAGASKGAPTKLALWQADGAPRAASFAGYGAQPSFVQVLLTYGNSDIAEIGF